MDILKLAEKAMSMDERTWQRHSNPLSVYTRFTALPLLSLALWSRIYLGWYAVIPVLLAVIWIWLNPRVFPAPGHTDNWASMGTFGERIYLNRMNEKNIPNHHLVVCRRLILLQILGLPCWLYGVISLNAWALCFGTLWLILGKVWFVDRMVWLYLDLKDSKTEYQSWLTP